MNACICRDERRRLAFICAFGGPSFSEITCITLNINQFVNSPSLKARFLYRAREIYVDSENRRLGCISGSGDG
mgnify:CR=1 FL=1